MADHLVWLSMAWSVLTTFVVCTYRHLRFRTTIKALKDVYHDSGHRKDHVQAFADALRRVQDPYGTNSTGHQPNEGRSEECPAVPSATPAHPRDDPPRREA